jgi:hypothetical protein
VPSLGIDHVHLDSFVREEVFFLREEQGPEAHPHHIRNPQRLGVGRLAGASGHQQGCDDAAEMLPYRHGLASSGLFDPEVVPDHVGRRDVRLEHAEALPDVNAVLRGLVDLAGLFRRAEEFAVARRVVEPDAL